MDHLTEMRRSRIVRTARRAEMQALLDARLQLGLPTGLLIHWIESFANGRFNYPMQLEFEKLRHETYFGTED